MHLWFCQVTAALCIIYVPYFIGISVKIDFLFARECDIIWPCDHSDINMVDMFSSVQTQCSTVQTQCSNCWWFDPPLLELTPTSLYENHLTPTSKHPTIQIFWVGAAFPSSWIVLDAPLIRWSLFIYLVVFDFVHAWMYVIIIIIIIIIINLTPDFIWYNSSTVHLWTQRLPNLLSVITTALHHGNQSTENI